VEALRKSAAEERAAVRARAAAVEGQKAALGDERAEAEQRLARSEAALSDRLDRLLARKRALETELETVMGEILGADQQLNETRRCRPAPDARSTRRGSLWETQGGSL